MPTRRPKEAGRALGPACAAGWAVLPGTWCFVKATHEGCGVLPLAVPRSWVTGAQEDRDGFFSFSFPVKRGSSTALTS